MDALVLERRIIAFAAALVLIEQGQGLAWIVQAVHFPGDPLPRGRRREGE